MSRQDPHSYTDTDQGRVSELELALDVDFDAHKLHGEAVLKLAQPASGPLDLDTRDLAIDGITGLDGSPLEYDLAGGEWVHPGSIVASNGHVHEELCRDLTSLQAP